MQVITPPISTVVVDSAIVVSSCDAVSSQPCFSTPFFSHFYTIAARSQKPRAVSSYTHTNVTIQSITIIKLKNNGRNLRTRS